jgi:hypothetical protein
MYMYTEHVHRDRDHEAHSTQAYRVHVRALRNAQMSVDYFGAGQQVRTARHGCGVVLTSDSMFLHGLCILIMHAEATTANSSN